MIRAVGKRISPGLSALPVAISSSARRLDELQRHAVRLADGQERQLPSKRAAAAEGRKVMGLEVSRSELDAAEQGLQQLVRMCDAAAVMRGAPQYEAPEAPLHAIRLVVEQSPMLRQ